MSKRKFVISVDVSLPGKIRFQFPCCPGQIPPHVTLLYLESTMTGERITRLVRRAVARTKPFELELSAVRPVHPTGTKNSFTISLGVADSDVLTRLIGKICHVLNRPMPIYPPHCTLVTDLTRPEADCQHEATVGLWQPQQVRVATVTVWEKDKLEGAEYRIRSMNTLGPKLR